MQEQKKKKLNRLLNVYIFVGVLMWLGAALIILTPLAPIIVYRIYPDALDNERQSLTQNLDSDLEAFNNLKDQFPEEENPLPPFDPSLPVENTIIIPNFAVNSQIQEGDEPYAALENGPWRVPDFGTPEEQNYPVIIASHRWGVIGWSNDERRARSFVRLPEVVEGETIEIIWNQRKYIYEVYRAENADQINDYEADLILYTCQFYWPSSERVFRYAKRIN